MELSGEFEVSSKRDDVVSYLKDIEKVISTIPEVISSEIVDKNNAKIRVKAGISAIKGKFLATLQIQENENGIYITAKGSSSSGSIDLKALFIPRDDGGMTNVSWNVQMTVGGMIATMGSRVIDSALQKYIKILTESFKQRIEGK
ncbi:MAG: SRPBCC domain-containing protein [Thermoplasmatales archaeon]